MTTEQIGKLANDEALNWDSLWPNQDPSFLTACRSAFADGFMRGYHIADTRTMAERDHLRERVRQLERDIQIRDDQYKAAFGSWDKERAAYQQKILDIAELHRPQPGIVVSSDKWEAFLKLELEAENEGLADLLWEHKTAPCDMDSTWESIKRVKALHAELQLVRKELEDANKRKPI